ncbi:MAG: glucokinase [Polyangiaceae bacterium]
MKKKSFDPGAYLFADLGGTQLRTAFRGERLVQASGTEAHVKDALRDVVGGRAVKGVVIAAAGPVARGACELTNLGWTLTTAKLARWFAGAPCAILNDVEAQGYGALSVGPASRVRWSGPAKDPGGVRPTMLIVPGTGIGAALLLDDAVPRVFPTETGHASYGPNIGVGRDYANHVREHDGMATIETALAGRAFSQLFHFFEHEEPKFSTKAERAKVTAASDPNRAIVELAREGSNAARIVVGAYATFLAEEVRNAALRCGGDVWLAGGIVNALAPALRRSIKAVFAEPHPMSKWLSRVRVCHVPEVDLGLVGCSAFAKLMQG